MATWIPDRSTHTAYAIATPADKTMSVRLGGKSVVYFGLYDPQEVPGVHRKVIGVLAAAAANGYQTRAWAEPFRKTAPLKRLADAIDAAGESHIILRSLGFANLFLVPALLRARRRGARVTVDVASPNRVAVVEIWTSPQSLWRRVRTVIAFYISGPWSLWPASRIVQYANEGWWFQLGNRARTVEIGNGIDVAVTAPRRSRPAWPASRLNVIGVATVARWHGYDRVLQAVREFHDRPLRRWDVHVTIVGDGPSLPILRARVDALGLHQHVTFAGMVTEGALRALYESAHLAVSSLGLHRIGLSRASVLKAREYCAMGIPFMASGADPDFPSDTPFRLAVAGDDGTADLVRIFENFDSLHARFDDAAERRYAADRLDWRHKLHAFGLTQ
jgi:glycosyltransferase involved in cell wall biosynthesis